MPENLFEEIDKIYDSLPKIECQRKCQDSCGIIPMFWAEWYRIEKKLGKSMPLADIKSGKGDGHCPLLKDGACSVHEIRPLICRMWGVVEGMPCTFGCKPDKVVADEDSILFFSMLSEESQKVYKAVTGKDDPKGGEYMINANIERGKLFAGSEFE